MRLSLAFETLPLLIKRAQLPFLPEFAIIATSGRDRTLLGAVMGAMAALVMVVDMDADLARMYDVGEGGVVVVVRTGEAYQREGASATDKARQRGS